MTAPRVDRWLCVLAVLSLVWLPAPAGASPRLGVTEDQALAALTCTGDLASSTRAPVLLLHGSSSSPEENWGWNWVPTLDGLGWAHCELALPERGTQDLQVTAEYVVHVIRHMRRESGRRIDIVGHSQGGTVARWSLKYWPDTRQMVDDYVGLAAGNHGTDRFGPLCPTFGCSGGAWQQSTGSRFLEALNDGTEAWAAVDYTEITSEFDEVVSPPTSGWLTPGPNVTNVHVQEVCPMRPVDHFAMAFDNAVWRIALDALAHDGPARPARVDASACADVLMPGVDPVTFPAELAIALAGVVFADANATSYPSEPPVRCYARSDC